MKGVKRCVVLIFVLVRVCLYVYVLILNPLISRYFLMAINLINR